MKKRHKKGLKECFSHFSKRFRERFPELGECTPSMYDDIRRSVPDLRAKLIERESLSRKHYSLDMSGTTIRFVYNTNINLPVTVIREEDINTTAEQESLLHLYESESIGSEDL